MDVREDYQPIRRWHSTPTEKCQGHRYGREGYDRNSDFVQRRYPMTAGSPPYHHHMKFAPRSPPRQAGSRFHSSPRNGTNIRRGLSSSPHARRRIQFFNASADEKPSFPQDPWLKSKNIKETFAARVGYPTRPAVQLRYKTELCRAFEETGLCEFGKDCTFAHGFVELRAVSHHPKYKTDFCRSFHTWGYCLYGTRCHFVHNPDESGGMSPTGGYLIRKRQKELLSNLSQMEIQNLKPAINKAFLANLRQLYSVQCGGGMAPLETSLPSPMLNMNQVPMASSATWQMNPQPTGTDPAKDIAAILHQLNFLSLADSPTAFTNAVGGHPANPDGYLNTTFEHQAGANPDGYLNTTFEHHAGVNLDGSMDTSMNKGSESSNWSCSSVYSSPPKDSPWKTIPSPTQPTNFPETCKPMHPLYGYVGDADMDYGHGDAEMAQLLSASVAEAVIENSY